MDRREFLGGAVALAVGGGVLARQTSPQTDWLFADIRVPTWLDAEGRECPQPHWREDAVPYLDGKPFRGAVAAHAGEGWLDAYARGDDRIYRLRGVVQLLRGNKERCDELWKAREYTQAELAAMGELSPNQSMDFSRSGR